MRTKKIHTNFSFLKPSYYQTAMIAQAQEANLKINHIEGQQNFQEHSTFQPEYQTTTYANIHLFKLLNYLLSQRTYRAQLFTDKNGYRNSGLPENLYWSERQLNESITRWNNT